MAVPIGCLEYADVVVAMTRVVIAGLGDSGVLTAIRLARHAEVAGISAKPGLVSGQELGNRLARPADWARNYWIPFDRFRGLDQARTLHASLTGLDPDRRIVAATRADGATVAEPYDVLVVSTGVSNGFWRQPNLQSEGEIAEHLRAAHQRLAAADSVIVVGGGAAAVSSAANLATVWPGKKVALYFPADRPLTGHHPRAWNHVGRRLAAAGVGLHPGHRALLPDGFRGEEITSDPVEWITGQLPATADAVLWAVGMVRPNTGWLPPELLDERGFVRVTPQLQTPDHPEIFAVGDVAATDALRGSARNRADRLLASNIRAYLGEKPLHGYQPATRRWGSVLGVQPDGLEVFAPSGFAFRFPGWSIDKVLQPWIVRRGIYRGIRDNGSTVARVGG